MWLVAGQGIQLFSNRPSAPPSMPPEVMRLQEPEGSALRSLATSIHRKLPREAASDRHCGVSRRISVSAEDVGFMRACWDNEDREDKKRDPRVGYITMDIAIHRPLYKSPAMHERLKSFSTGLRAVTRCPLAAARLKVSFSEKESNISVRFVTDGNGVNNGREESNGRRSDLCDLTMTRLFHSHPVPRHSQSDTGRSQMRDR
ncbi:hypothetical protein RRG08_043616 [Elysia crispata]|uniref:Uncharacterized protein n=1 Tax=Elysia crispata TaxID=231223 RepID=A0AAE1DSW5_9GAST|nr:hypothetical protein RRG08_043616 [Elysia crispata]